MFRFMYALFTLAIAGVLGINAWTGSVPDVLVRICEGVSAGMFLSYGLLALRQMTRGGPTTDPPFGER